MTYDGQNTVKSRLKALCRLAFKRGLVRFFGVRLTICHDPGPCRQ